MWIVQVHPCKKAILALQPLERFCDYDVAAFLIRTSLKRVGIVREAARQPGLPLEHSRGDERAGRKPLTLEEVCQKRNVGAERRRHVVADAVFRRVEAREK
jgi:hypothetical protein